MRRVDTLFAVESYRDMPEFEKKLRMHLNKEIKTIEGFQKAKNTIKSGSSKVQTTESTKAISESFTSCEVLFEHDENGVPMNGSVERLIEAVIKGCPIKSKSASFRQSYSSNGCTFAICGKWRSLCLRC